MGAEDGGRDGEKVGNSEGEDDGCGDGGLLHPGDVHSIKLANLTPLT